MSAALNGMLLNRTELALLLRRFSEGPRDLPVLAHRLAPSIEARLHSQAPRERLAAIIAQTPVPVEEVWTGSA